MFYIKHKIAEGVILETELDGEVMTRCPECGTEMTFDLKDLAKDPEFDFFGTHIYCAACSEKMKGAHHAKA